MHSSFLYDLTLPSPLNLAGLHRRLRPDRFVAVTPFLACTLLGRPPSLVTPPGTLQPRPLPGHVDTAD